MKAGVAWRDVAFVRCVVWLPWQRILSDYDVALQQFAMEIASDLPEGNRASSPPIVEVVSRFGDHHLGRFDDGSDYIAFLQTHLFEAATRDDRFDESRGGPHGDVCEDITDLDFFDRALQMIACAECHCILRG
jgi:hypothetical protein